MSEAKFTPGPWELIAEPELTVVIASGEPRIDNKAFGVALIPHGDGANAIPWETKEANARLIAAAPDLLAACQATVEMFDAMFSLFGPLQGREGSVRQMLVASISKATGEP